MPDQSGLPENLHLPDILDVMQTAAEQASLAVLEVYRKDATVEWKTDGSPVTEADHRAEECILAALAPLGLPVLAEESVSAGRIPQLGHTWFVVDPLDGTKEFLARNGEFTVNIGLIHDNYPVAGIIIAPDLNKAYIGSALGAFSFEPGSNWRAGTPVTVSGDTPIRLATSRSHRNSKASKVGAALGTGSEIRIGSSLKLCLLADGQANLYPRLSPTCEWDIGAGQAILEAAGGSVLTLDGERLSYGKAGANFLNPWFVAASTRALAARAIGIAAAG